MPQSRRKSLAKKAGRCGKTCTDQPFCYNDYIHKQGKAGWMKIYTSYFGRAAIPTTTYEGVKSIIERKTKAGEISQPWEIFENMLGETYGARRRKAD